MGAPVATSVSGKGAIDECLPLAVGWGYGPQGTVTGRADRPLPAARRATAADKLWTRNPPLRSKRFMATAWPCVSDTAIVAATRISAFCASVIEACSIKGVSVVSPSANLITH